MQATWFSFDDFELDVVKLELWRSGELVRAEGLTLRLLELFVRNPGKLLTKDQLLLRAWDGRVTTENSLMVAMTRLRKALGQRPGEQTWLVTVHGHGYRFVRPVVQREAMAHPSATEAEPPRFHAPFIGRGASLQALGAALDSMLGGSGGLVVISGEVGIGKTRLAEVFAERAQQRDLGVAWGYCHDDLDTPALWPFVQMLREIMLCSRASRAALEHPRHEHMRAQIARMLPELAAELPTPPSAADSTKLLLFDAVAQWLSRVTAERPWLLVIDDLHRAEPASVELLLYLPPLLRRMRCLIIATVREPELAPSPDRSGLRRVRAHRNCHELHLARLDAAEVVEFVSAWLGERNAAVSQRIFQLSEGNPFFMQQLTHSLRSAELSQLELPERLLDLLQERFALLAPGTLADLQVGAVQGRRFSLSVLSAVTGCEQSALIASIDAAVGCGMVGAVADSQNHFAFTHELLRDALYRSIPEKVKRRHHLRIAQTLEEQRARGLDVSAAELAHHFRCALPHADPRKVIDCCRQAASAANAVFAHADAARHLRHALETLDTIEGGSPRLRLQLLFRLAYCVRAIESHEFLPLIEEVIRLATRQRLGEVLAGAALLLSASAGFPSFPGWPAALRDALALLPADVPEIRAGAMARLAISGPLAYDEALAHAQLTAASELAGRASGHLDRYLTLNTELFLYGGPAHRAHAAETLLHTQQLIARHPHELAVAPIFLDVHHAILALQAGEQSAASDAITRTTARTRELSGMLWWPIDRFRVLCRVNAHGAASERAALQELFEAEARHNAGGSELLCAYDRSVLLGEALEWSSWPCLAVREEDPPNIWALKARALLAGGLRREAEQALEHVSAERLASLPCDRDYLGTLGALTHVAVALDARAYVEALYPLLSPHRERFAVSISFVCDGSISTLTGMLAYALGRHEEAREAVAFGLRASERAGYRDCAAAARALLDSYTRV